MLHLLRSFVIFYFSLLLAMYGKAQNIMISDTDNPNEPSIAIDPKHPDRLVAGANINSYYYSRDGGKTWEEGRLQSTYGVWGDPVIDVDTGGDFYFFHLSNPPQDGHWVDRIVCQKSTDGGVTWSPGTFTGRNGTKVQDKHWTIIDRNTNQIFVTWTQFDKYNSSDPKDSSNILFSTSTDGGASWSPPQQINHVSGDCVDSDNTVEGAVPALGPNGEIYVAWAGPDGIVFNRSLDTGKTWLAREIHVSDNPGGWDYSIPGIYRANGLPVTKCDLSHGKHRGTIYVNWSDQRNGENDTDIWLSKSTDGGNTWSTPVRVNDDPGQKHQFLTWMDIDRTTGYLFFVFYDRRNYNDNRTDVYLAISKDGGETFINRRISERPFLPNEGIFFGDYNNIVAHDGIVRPIWTRLHEGKLSLWTDITDLDTLLSTGAPLKSTISYPIKQYPNPTDKMSYISFKLHAVATVSLVLRDVHGKRIKTLFTNRKMHPGKHIIPVDTHALGLLSGVYYTGITINGQSQTLKNVVVK